MGDREVGEELTDLERTMHHLGTRIRWKPCKGGCGEEFFMLPDHGHCPRCAAREGLAVHKEDRRPLAPSLRDKIRAAREAVEQKRFG